MLVPGGEIDLILRPTLRRKVLLLSSLARCEIARKNLYCTLCIGHTTQVGIREGRVYLPTSEARPQLPSAANDDIRRLLIELEGYTVRLLHRFTLCRVTRAVAVHRKVARRRSRSVLVGRRFQTSRGVIPVDVFV